ncbi:hypothetical protein GCM10010252_56470 [Streptomyces aureoverticillatus]|nr:hypothetical protein GCM10010252_56470 [Streptomyces aureoverticillatus]
MRIRTAATRTLATLAALTALLTPTATAHADPGDTVNLPVRDALTALPVADEDRIFPAAAPPGRNRTSAPVPSTPP